ncbi:MAG: GntP family permease [Bacteroidales bacterium]|nr:GntP family permease [Bacteroidales bacterium]
MMTSGWITPLLVFVAVIALMIFSISKLKIHPFLSILGCALLLALLMGIPLRSIADVIGKGFSTIFANIGLVIILGTLIGLVLERSGAALTLAESVLRVLGKSHPQLAIMLIGWIVSIPVFCDSGFVIVNPIRKWMSRKSGVSSVTMTVALAAGLYVAHVFIPPTPGPVAAAGLVGLGDNLMLVILVGAALSIFPLAAAYVFANKVGRKVHSTDEVEDVDLSEVVGDSNKRPSTLLSVLPIILPIVFMGIGSLVSVLKLQGTVADTFFFLGKPVIALAVGVIFSLPLLKYITEGKNDKSSSNLYKITENALRTSGTIVFITAAGAVLGQVIYDAGFVELIKANAKVFSTLGILFPFIIAAILKTAQGSSTVAMTTTAGMMGMFSSSDSLMAALGMTSPLSAALVVMAIGAGAMTVSHANDSYFWVVTRLGGLSVKDGYKTQTRATLIMGITSAIVLFAASMILV